MIDVVILTWNDGPMLDTAVQSALTSRDVDVRVIVVDNGSDPPAAVPADSRVTLVINTENRGVAAGRNQGARLGDAPLVCFLDSDARLHPDTLSHLVSALEAEPTRGLKCAGVRRSGARRQRRGRAHPLAETAPRPESHQHLRDRGGFIP